MTISGVYVDIVIVRLIVAWFAFGLITYIWIDRKGRNS